jgi:hypothetical protein
MFTADDLRALLHARPFVPFRLLLGDGGAVDVRSNGLAAWRRRTRN